ncbi:hypothetical protein C8Q75DRAFT_592076 [Abortiporus biennis]|nr:hypothetical protein C8Q75DRAFT_592076 [Abortiporus biennis]
MYLFRDGTKCFLCLMVLDAATLIGVKSMSGMGVLIVTEALGSILTTRFMLTLRGVYLSNQNSLDSSFHPSKMSNLNITTTTRVVGNLGAPLAYFSEPGPEARTDGRYDAGEDEDEELFYLSRCPLSVE